MLCATVARQPVLGDADIAASIHAARQAFLWLHQVVPH